MLSRNDIERRSLLSPNAPQSTKCSFPDEGEEVKVKYVSEDAKASAFLSNFQHHFGMLSWCFWVNLSAIYCDGGRGLLGGCHGGRVADGGCSWLANVWITSASKRHLPLTFPWSI